MELQKNFFDLRSSKSVMLCLSILLFTNCLILAQNKLNYAYDADGNRIERTISMTRSASVTTEFYEEIIAEKNVKIYPNPTKGQLKVEISNTEINSGSIQVFDMNGRKIIQQKITEITTPIDLSNYSTGTYILKIQLNNESSNWKIIKE